MILLFRFGRNVLDNCYIVYKVCFFFCINFVSIFMVVFYLEILYFFCVVYGFYYLESSRKMLIVFMFVLSLLVRFNGLFNIGFIFYDSFIFLGMILRSFFFGILIIKMIVKMLVFRICIFFNIVLV